MTGRFVHPRQVILPASGEQIVMSPSILPASGEQIVMSPSLKGNNCIMFVIQAPIHVKVGDTTNHVCDTSTNTCEGE